MSVHPVDLAEASRKAKGELLIYGKKVKLAVFFIKIVQCVCVVWEQTETGSRDFSTKQQKVKSENSILAQ